MAEGLPPDVVFAQKATAIVKAAGMDPKSMDLESFRKWAPMIFTRAYCAIYKEKLISELSEFSSKEEQILNAQLVIDGMLAKTRNPTLASITGIDIFQGNHKAIGILVGVLFAEGQRMWMEKAKARKLAQEQAEQQLLASDRLMTPLRTTELDGRPESQSPVNSPGAAPPNTDLDKLLHRINYLETKLRRKGARKSKSWRESRSPAGNSPLSKSHTRPASASATRPREDPHSDLSDSHGVDDEDPLAKRDEDDEEGQARDPLRPTSRQNRRRPASSPGLRRGKVSDRLYNAPLNRRAMEDLVASNTPLPPPAPKERFDSSLYTYDMKSGRRILISQAEAEKEEIRRKKAAMGNIMGITDYEDEMMAGKKAPAPPLSPGRSEYPGKRIEKSVEEWLSKMRRDRLSTGKKKSRHASPGRGQGDAHGQYRSSQREFAMYGSLERLDVLVTVEHCHSCESHRISLRHNAVEYVKLADSMLVHLAQEVLSGGFCVRVAVARLEAHFDPNQETEEGMRYGAFEVQVACRTPAGRVEVDVLHSKLVSRRWPSKSVLAKRLQAFLSKHRLPLSGMLKADDFVMTHEGQQTYPVGKCAWNDTPLSDGKWSFASFQALRSRTPMQYVFDWREIHDAPLYPPGSTVWVRHAVFHGHTEPHPLLATVCASSPEASSPGEDKTVLVQFKYSPGEDKGEEVRVKETQCMSVHEHRGDDFHAGEVSGVALELQGALQLAHAEKLLGFQAEGIEDRINSRREVELSRATFFRQVREMVWQTVQRLHTRQVHVPVHPTLEMPFDIHLAYSEAVLDALFARFGSRVNCAQLVDMLGLAPPKEDARREKEEEEGGHTPVASKPVRPVGSERVVNGLEVLHTTCMALLDCFPSLQRLEAFCDELCAAPGPAVPLLAVVDKLSDYGCDVVAHSHTVMEVIASAFKPVNDGSGGGGGGGGGDHAGTISVAAFTHWLRTSWHQRPDHQPVEPVQPVQPAIPSHSAELLAGLADAILATFSEASLAAFRSELHAVAAEAAGGVGMDVVCEKLAGYGCDVLAGSTAAVAAISARFQLDSRAGVVSSSELCAWLQEAWRRMHADDAAPDEQAAPPAETAPPPKLVSQRTESDSLLVDFDALPAAGPSSEPEEPEAAVAPPPSDSPRRDDEEGVQAPAPAPAPGPTPGPDPAGEAAESAPLPAQVSGLLHTDSEAGLGGGATAAEDEYNESFLHVSQLEDPEAKPAPPAGPADEPLSARSAEETATGDQVGRLLSNMDVVISAIIVEGAVLSHEGYDSICAILELNGQRHQTNSCLGREKQSKRRTFNVDWGEIALSVHQFQTGQAHLTLVCTDEAVAAKHPRVPLLSSLPSGACPQVHVPLHQFSVSSFEIKVDVLLPDLAATASTQSPVGVTIQGHAHEAREARTTRILSMKPTDLVNLKFDPIPGVDDYNSDDQESVDEEGPGRRGGGGGGGGGAGGARGLATESSLDLHNALFPKPSLPDLKAVL